MPHINCTIVRDAIKQDVIFCDTGNILPSNKTMLTFVILIFISFVLFLVSYFEVVETLKQFMVFRRFKQRYEPYDGSVFELLNDDVSRFTLHRAEEARENDLRQQMVERRRNPFVYNPSPSTSRGVQRPPDGDDSAN